MRKIAILGCVSCLAFCPTFAEAAEKLSVDEVRNQLSDRTMVGSTAGGIDYTLHYGVDGNVSVDTETHGSDTGKWRVKQNGNFCVEYNVFFDGIERCYILSLSSGKPKAVYASDGSPTYWDFKNK